MHPTANRYGALLSVIPFASMNSFHQRMRIHTFLLATVLLTACSGSLKTTDGVYQAEKVESYDGCALYRITREGVNPAIFGVCKDTISTFEHSDGWITIETKCGMSYRYHPETKVEEYDIDVADCPENGTIMKFGSDPMHPTTGENHWKW